MVHAQPQQVEPLDQVMLKCAHQGYCSTAHNLSMYQIPVILPKVQVAVAAKHAPYTCGFAWSDTTCCMVYTECAQIAAVPHGNSHVTTKQCCKCVQAKTTTPQNPMCVSVYVCVLCACTCMCTVVCVVCVCVCVCVYECWTKLWFLPVSKPTGQKSGMPSWICSLAISALSRFLWAGFVMPMAVRSWNKCTLSFNLQQYQAQQCWRCWFTLKLQQETNS